VSARLAAALAASLILQQRPAFKSGVDLVSVDVSVTRGTTPVKGLKAENFQLTDNGILQDVESVSLDSRPISVMLVLDTSDSVAGEELARLIDAGRQVVRALHPDDRAALVTFSEQVLVNVPLTSDLASVDRALTSLKGLGATSLNDAIHVAMNLRPADTSRPVILVFSDGADNLSWSSGASLVDEAKHAGVVIHAIALRSDQSAGSSRVNPAAQMNGIFSGDAGLFNGAAARPTSPALLTQGFVNGTPVLQALALAAGGRVWSAKSSGDLKGLFTHALEEMRARYLLTYTPNGAPQEGWHTVNVTLKNARGDVTARPGYFVASKEPTNDPRPEAREQVEPRASRE
jgi:VWFA-related protein